jgi:hypothetical protein
VTPKPARSEDRAGFGVNGRVSANTGDIEIGSILIGRFNFFRGIVNSLVKLIR